MPLQSLQDLLIDELRDLYSAEKQLVKALPKMAKAASSPKLKTAFESHLEETQGHVDRLEKIFETLGERATGKKCKGMEGLVEEGKEVLDEDGMDAVRDAGIIAAAQRVEHYEMAAYGCSISFARLLGYQDIVTELEHTLEEEKAADEKLTSIAEGEVNEAALEAGAQMTGD